MSPGPQAPGILQVIEVTHFSVSLHWYDLTTEVEEEEEEEEEREAAEAQDDQTEEAPATGHNSRKSLRSSLNPLAFIQVGGDWVVAP